MSVVSIEFMKAGEKVHETNGNFGIGRRGDDLDSVAFLVAASLLPENAQDWDRVRIGFREYARPADHLVLNLPRAGK